MEHAKEALNFNSFKYMYQNYNNIEYVKPAGLDLKDRLVGVQRVTKVTKGVRNCIEGWLHGPSYV